MGPVNGKGFAVGAAVWVVITVIHSMSTSCAEFKDCGRGDLILNSIIAVGSLFPAWFAASFASDTPPDKKE